MPPEPVALEERPRQRLLSVQEVADWLQVSLPTVRREVERGELRAKRVGRQLRFDSEWVRDYIRRR